MLPLRKWFFFLYLSLSLSYSFIHSFVTNPTFSLSYFLSFFRSFSLFLSFMFILSLSLGHLPRLKFTNVPNTSTFCLQYDILSSDGKCFYYKFENDPFAQHLFAIHSLFYGHHTCWKSHFQMFEHFLFRIFESLQYFPFSNTY